MYRIKKIENEQKRRQTVKYQEIFGEDVISTIFIMAEQKQQNYRKQKQIKNILRID